jgi:hypothetical protein
MELNVVMSCRLRNKTEHEYSVLSCYDCPLIYVARFEVNENAYKILVR